VGGLEHGQLLADVAGAAEAEAAHHLGAEVADDVPVQVRRHQHVVVERILQEPHAHGVDVGVVGGDAGVALGHFLEGLEEQPVGGADHVGLVDAGHLLPVELLRELEGGPDDPFGALLGVDLRRDRVLIEGHVLEGGERFRDLQQGVFQLLGHRVELDARVQVLGVLPEDHQVDPFFEVERIAGVGLAWPQADVQVEQLTHADDGGAVDQPRSLELGDQLRLGGLHRLRGDGAEQGGIDVFEQIDGARGEGIAFLAPELPTDVAVDVLGVQTEAIQDDLGSLVDLDADSVAGEPGNAILGHKGSPYINGACTRRRPLPIPPGQTAPDQAASGCGGAKGTSSYHNRGER